MIKIIYGIFFFLGLNQLYGQNLLMQEVKLINKSGDTLYGSNTFSSKTSNPYFVLIIAGSGPIDRN
ncbi:MAG: hypothetical protein ACK4ON_08405, partial [Bacteroidia bacterium]